MGRNVIMTVKIRVYIMILKIESLLKKLSKMWTRKSDSYILLRFRSKNSQLVLSSKVLSESQKG